MSANAWRAAALVLLVLLLGKLLVGAIHSRGDAARQQSAADTLAKVTMHLDSARARLSRSEVLARAGVRQSAAYKATLDSIWAVGNARIAARRRAPRLPVLVDVGDSLAVVREITTLTEERDDEKARADMWEQTAADIKTAGITHAADDSVRYGAIAAQSSGGIAAVDSAERGVHAARALVRPRWYRRFGGFVARGAKVTAVAGLAFLIGRAT